MNQSCMDKSVDGYIRRAICAFFDGKNYHEWAEREVICGNAYKKSNEYYIINDETNLMYIWDYIMDIVLLDYLSNIT